MLQVPLFFVRRLLFIMAMQCKIFSVQYGGIVNLVIGYLSYLLDQMPYENPGQMYLEIFNELFLMSSLYILPLFTDWVEDPKVQYEYGWVFVYTLAPLFMINIGFVIMLAIEMCLTGCKRKAIRKMLLAQRE